VTQRPIIILSGDIGSGKTTVCCRLAEIARSKKFNPSGIVSPAVFENGLKTGIRVVDLKLRKSKPLATLRDKCGTGLAIGRWTFDLESILWANQVLETATPCRLLIIDELGPLEMYRGQGFTAGLKTLDSEAYRSAVVVIRVGLLEAALTRWPHALVRKIAHEKPPEKAAHDIFRYLMPFK